MATKKLIAPDIADGDWLVYRGINRDGSPFRDGRTVKAQTGDDALVVAYCDYLWPERAEANALFLAGSKRVAEAAAELVNNHDAVAQKSGFRNCGCSDCTELRDALIASGFKESD